MSRTIQALSAVKDTYEAQLVLSDAEGVRESFEKAAALDPEHQDARRRLGEVADR